MDFSYDSQTSSILRSTNTGFSSNWITTHKSERRRFKMTWRIEYNTEVPAEPVQLGRAWLSPTEKERRRQDRLRFYCGESSHKLSNCIECIDSEADGNFMDLTTGQNLNTEVLKLDPPQSLCDIYGSLYFASLFMLLLWREERWNIVSLHPLYRIKHCFCDILISFPFHTCRLRAST